jgi:L-alanine-DL-glutamate epimerase-like enolase superfamily enzyme
LWQEVPVPVKGELTVPAKPGLGLEFSRELDRYVVG